MAVPNMVACCCFFCSSSFLNKNLYNALQRVANDSASLPLLYGIYSFPANNPSGTASCSTKGIINLFNPSAYPNS